MIRTAAMLSLPFVIVVVVAAWIFVGQYRSAIELTSRERVGVGYTTRNEAVVYALRSLRDRIEIDEKDPMPARRHVQRALDDLYTYNSTAGRNLELTKRLARFQMWWGTLDSRAPAPWQIDATVGSAVHLFYFIDDGSFLNTDPDPRNAALIDALGTQLPAFAERLDRAKVVMMNGLRAGRVAPTQRIEAASLLGQARWAYSLIADDVGTATKVDTKLHTTLSKPLHRLGRELRLFDAASKAPVFAWPEPHPAFENLKARAASLTAAEQSLDGALATGVDDTLSRRLVQERIMVPVIVLIALLLIAFTVSVLAHIARTTWHRDRAELRHAQEAAERLSAELARQRALEELSLSEAQFQAVFDGSPTGVAILGPSGALIKANRALLQMFDPLDPAKIGAAHPAFIELIAGRRESFSTEMGAENMDGTSRWFDISVSLVRDDDQRPLFAMSMVKDVTERKRRDDRLRYDASHDALSGLPNRAFFFKALQAVHANAETSTGQAAVLFVDLDEFKFINDSLGHAVGDRVLVAAGARLHEAAGPGDVVARLGGDEFAILTRVRPSARHIGAFVERIERALARPLRVDGRDIFVTASIGVAMVDRSYHAVEDILRDADTAMYYAKSSGRSRHAFFNRAMHAQASRRLELATQLRYALERDEFYLVYQPVVSMITGRTEAFEALLRWKHPTLGMISPGEFIPIAEDIGLIVPIGRLVAEQACKQLASWRAASSRFPAVRLNINASVREIVQADYAPFLARLVNQYGLQRNQLVVEITEGSILTSGKVTETALRRIKASGVGLSIDDFGTGYSSLRYLQQYPFDELKIDRSFVAGPDGNLGSEAIVTMLLSLAKAVGVNVVAEGVETAMQAARLRSLGCTSAQGYFYGVPAREIVLADLLRRAEPIAM